MACSQTLPHPNHPCIISPKLGRFFTAIKRGIGPGPPLFLNQLRFSRDLDAFSKVSLATIQEEIFGGSAQILVWKQPGFPSIKSMCTDF